MNIVSWVTGLFKIKGDTDGTKIGNVSDAMKVYMDGASSAIHPFYYSAAHGHITNHTPYTKPGLLPDLDNGITSDVTPFGDIVWMDTAATLDVVSTSTLDIDTTGTGARTIMIFGLDANWDKQVETVNLNGTTTVTTTNTFIRVNAIHVMTCGNTSFNQGTITVKDASDIISQIDPKRGVSEQLSFSVPRDFVATILGVRASVTNSSGSGDKQANVTMWFRMFGNAWWVGGGEGITSAGGASETQPVLPLVLPPKADFRLAAFAFQNNTQVTAILQYVEEPAS